MKKSNKSGFLDMSFSWMFALIVGAFILFGAIFFVVKLISTEQTSSNIQTSNSLGIITNPLETGVSETKVMLLNLPTETKIYNDCDDSGNFGEQLIRSSLTVFNKQEDNPLETSFENRYFFSENQIDGKEFYLFSKSFEFPFKVAGLIYIIPKTKNYCFVNSPKEISEELKNLGLNNIINVSRMEDCKEGSVKVCFEGSCEIIVKYALGYVQKGSNRLYFEGIGGGINKGIALMYGAIFSEKELYECQVKRLMKRTLKLAEIYEGKASIVALKGCDSNSNFDSLKSSISVYKDSSNLISIMPSVMEMKVNNEVGVCGLW
jgi:hypothetical protein